MSESEKITILLVDDRPENLFALGRIFEDSGYILLLAGSGYEALRIVLQTHIDLILLDVRMPGMDGYQTCERLKANERTRDIPVIFISALDDIRDKINGFKAGGVDYVTKPPQAEEVLARVNAHLAIRQLQRELQEKNQELRLKNDELQLALERERVLLERERKLTDDLRMSLSLSLPHELRTPLNAILGFSELLMLSPEMSTVEQIRQYGKNIYEGGRRLERIVENSLFYAKLQVIMYTSEESRLRSLAESFDAAEVILAVIRQQAECFRRHADLSADLLHANLRASSGNFTKIVIELLNNAFKFSKPNTPVRVAMRLSHSQCIVQINDQGRGMTPEQIAEIGAYMQFDRRRHEQQGVGLGLIVASLLTQLEGGSLSIESAIKQGTTVTLAFPCEEQPEQAEKGSFTYQGKESESPAIVPPPRERLEQLRKSVVIGDILNVQKQIEAIRNLAPQYIPFAERLYPLARDLNISAIEQILQLYLGDREY